MKHQMVLTAGLLLWTLAAADLEKKKKQKGIEVKKIGGNRIQLVCADVTGVTWTKNNDVQDQPNVEYADTASGEYTCTGNRTSGSSKVPFEVSATVLVKIRTCDNCIEMDLPSIMGLAVGDLVATAVIGVAVYLLASNARSGAVAPPQKKSSDRQHLVSNEVTGRGSNDHYQQLRHKGQRDTYDVINKH